MPFCAYTDLGQVNASGDAPLYVRPASVPMTADACPAGNYYMVLSADDVAGLKDGTAWFSLAPGEGSLIAGSILLLWAGAWAIRQVSKALNSDSAST